MYGRGVDEPDDRTLLANAAVRLALTADELVMAIRRDPVTGHPGAVP